MIIPLDPGHSFLWVGNNSFFCDIINSHLDLILETDFRLVSFWNVPVLRVLVSPLGCVCVRHCGFTHKHTHTWCCFLTSENAL